MEAIQNHVESNNIYYDSSASNAVSKEGNVFYQPDAISIEGDQKAYLDRQTHYTATVTSTKGKTAQDVI